jgi:epsilon-lactone hydrolase
MSDGWGLPPLRKGTDPPEGLVSRRAAISVLRSGDPATGTDVSFRYESIGGVDSVVCEPAHAAAGSILHFHGGGYRLGSAELSAPFGARLAAATSYSVVLPDYRLAPEHPFPGALHDAAAVYSALAERDASPIVLSGDSAGGGLAAALAVAVLRVHFRPPVGLMMFSPWLDMRVSAATFASRAESDVMFSKESATEAAAGYLQGVSDQDPLASPLLADVAGFPPTLVFAGEDEVLLDDALAFTAALARANVTVQAHFEAGMQHVWPVAYPDLPQSDRAFEIAARFVETIGSAG